MLAEYGFVWWLDSSVRFKSRDITHALSEARKNGILYNTHHDVRNTLGIVKQTDPRTFSFLREDSCKFRPFSEISATTILVHYSNVTWSVIKAWVTCALDKHCIAPEGTRRKINCNTKDPSDGRCHRFDQSVLGILLRRVHHESDVYSPGTALNDAIEIRRNEVVHYFEDCEPIDKCIV